MSSHEAGYTLYNIIVWIVAGYTLYNIIVWIVVVYTLYNIHEWIVQIYKFYTNYSPLRNLKLNRIKNIAINNLI